MTFCFVVLHYKTADDTIKCIESIKNLNEVSQIVVVDNFSDNGSIEIIEAEFRDDTSVVIIKNKENLGFAAGNNVGYEYAKKHLNADFIAISNNDIIIETKSFISDMFKLYSDEEFYVAGPDIESLVDHKHQSPMKTTNIGLRKAKKEILRYRLLWLASKLKIYDILSSGKNKSKTETLSFCNTIIRNCKLHGSFIVFSPSFIAMEEEAFRSGTFLYMEETILYEYCMKMNYSTVYTPYVKVFHKEDSSTNSLFNTTCKKREFVFRNMIKSLKVYVQMISEE